MSILIQFFMKNTLVLDMINITQDCSNLYSELHMKISYVVNDLEYGMDASRLLPNWKYPMLHHEGVWEYMNMRDSKESQTSDSLSGLSDSASGSSVFHLGGDPGISHRQFNAWKPCQIWPCSSGIRFLSASTANRNFLLIQNKHGQ